MPEELKTLIEKIKKEGVEAGRKKAEDIERAAKESAEEVLAKARTVAQRLREEAQEKIRQEEAASRAGLQQAGRDLLLFLRQQIIATLDRLIAEEVRKALTAEEMAGLITHLVKEAKVSGGGIEVSLSKHDAERLEEGFLAHLKKELKKDIVLKEDEDIGGGFVISFDAGKSHFDFSDKALAEYLGKSLRPRLAELLTPESDGKD